MLAPTPRRWRSQGESHSSCVNCSKGLLPVVRKGNVGYLILDLYQRLWPDTLSIPPWYGYRADH